MHNILLTGGAGFIGSHVLEALVRQYPDASIVVLDRMTYAADYENIVHVLDRGRRSLKVGTVTDLALCNQLAKDADCIIHVAAESHVDNSFGNSIEFTLSNTLGTHTLLEAARINRVPLFVHVSTDEVYGEVLDGEATESHKLDPSNPYSASKASAEMIVGSYRYSYSLPVITVRANNIFGIRQFPEKIVPKFTMQMLFDKPLTIHGNGSNSRKYLAVEDFADAILTLIENGKVGETYNVGSDEEYTNYQVARLLCRHFGKAPDATVVYVEDRPFNDRRYSISSEKIRGLGWNPTRRLKDSLPAVVDWYRQNQSRYLHLFSD